MPPDQITATICSTFSGVVAKSSWGETAMFYNPGRALPNGIYFCTIKQHDGENDKASKLDRDGVFRVAIGLSRQSYMHRFGDAPGRPAKGAVVATGDDFTALNVLMPHPIYAWMCWVQIINPTTERFKDDLLPLLAEAHGIAVTKFAKRTAKTRVHRVPSESNGGTA
jgi:hypothetical protein